MDAVPVAKDGIVVKGEKTRAGALFLEWPRMRRPHYKSAS